MQRAENMSRRPRRNHRRRSRPKVAIEALTDGKTIAEIAQKLMTCIQTRSPSGGASLSSARPACSAAAAPEAPPVDLKALHAKIGQLTLENDF